MITIKDLLEVSYIIGPLTQENFNEFRKLAEENNMAAKSSTLRHPSFTVNEDSALKIYLWNNLIMYSVGSLKNYKFYIDSKHSAYKKSRLVTYQDFMDKFYAHDKVKEAEPVVVSQDHTLGINSERLKAAYKLTCNEDIKTFCRIVFGNNFFAEKTYKVGDKFTFGGETYALTKINSNVVTMIDAEGYTNFGNAIPVKNINAITEAEFKKLLGIYTDKFVMV